MLTLHLQFTDFYKDAPSKPIDRSNDVKPTIQASQRPEQSHRQFADHLHQLHQDYALERRLFF